MKCRKRRWVFIATHLLCLTAVLHSAHVVRIPNANHYVFRSNEADVLHEMNAFINSLPATN